MIMPSDWDRRNPNRKKNMNRFYLLHTHKGAKCLPLAFTSLKKSNNLLFSFSAPKILTLQFSKHVSIQEYDRILSRALSNTRRYFVLWRKKILWVGIEGRRGLQNTLPQIQKTEKNKGGAYQILYEESLQICILKRQKIGLGKRIIGLHEKIFRWRR